MKRILTLAAALLLALPLLQAQEVQKINKKNLVIKEWNTDARTNARVLDHVTTYSSEGKKIEEIEYSGSRQKWRKRYEYGTDGKVSRELIYNEYNKLEAVKKYTYNEFGRKHTQYNYDGRGKLQTIKVFEYITQDV
ncbi:MAG: hypothetical protein IJP93_04930 [Bacteroidales bacterium]|nr:hypothetical protein [Bacteroidales bacterium]MBR0030500.1 hypothetical protein [Bacteroidales bacterium]MBR0083407.1 hypothetical protein [Bacteroidales bacterium]MBR0291791.1 hypothetical protein [Bacteroidales bacterium]